MLASMIKEWKKSGYILGSAAVKNKIAETNKLIVLGEQMDYSPEQIRVKKALASYLRNEISEKELDRITIGYTGKLDTIVGDEEIYDLALEADKISFYKEHSRPSFSTPIFAIYQDYARFKAFYALYNNKITRSQFDKLYPWKYTLEVFNDLLYFYFRYKKPKVDPLEDSEETGNFMEDFPRETELFMEELDKQLKEYENILNGTNKYHVSKEVQKYSNLFFTSVEKRLLKINPEKACPEYKTCEESRDPETCAVYFYPLGYREDRLS